MKIRDDLTAFAYVAFESTDFTPSPEPNVERKMLERDGAEVARATSIVRYRAQSSFPEHTHELGEEFVVLEGTFGDEHGSYPAGTYVRNPPGSKHRPFSTPGCIIFVKLRQFDPSDARRVVTQLEWGALLGERGAGSASTLLHEFASERVSLVELGPEASFLLERPARGAELLVLEGAMSLNGVALGVWSWARVPSGPVDVQTPLGCAFWLKQGHLPA